MGTVGIETGVLHFHNFLYCEICLFVLVPYTDKNGEDQRQSQSPKVKVTSQVTGKGGEQLRISGAGSTLFSNMASGHPQ